MPQKEGQLHKIELTSCPLYTNESPSLYFIIVYYKILLRESKRLTMTFHLEPLSMLRNANRSVTPPLVTPLKKYPGQGQYNTKYSKLLLTQLLLYI